MTHASSNKIMSKPLVDKSHNAWDLKRRQRGMCQSNHVSLGNRHKVMRLSMLLQKSSHGSRCMSTCLSPRLLSSHAFLSSSMLQNASISSAESASKRCQRFVEVLLTAQI